MLSSLACKGLTAVTAGVDMDSGLDTERPFPVSTDAVFKSLAE
jgi:hypothetical protein